MSEKEPIKFMQRDYNGLIRGMAVIRTEPSSQLLKAYSELFVQVNPYSFYKIYGKEDSELFHIPGTEGLLGEHHPDAKEFKGPFLKGEVKVMLETMPEEKLARVSFVKAWPYVHAIVCMNEDYPVDKEIYFEEMPLCYEATEFCDLIEKDIRSLSEKFNSK